MTTIRLIPLLAAAGLSLACGKGSTTSSPPAGGGGGGTPVAGIAVPSEVSALPTSGSGAAAARSLIRGRATAPPAGSDYDLAVTRKFVNEQALSQFDILNTIFQAMAQTHYDDPANVGQGPYGAMVSWVEDHGGDGQNKQIVSWVVDSAMVDGVNLVKVWMLMPMGDGQIHLIKVRISILEPPARRDDGSYSDYGVWRIDAKFDPMGNGFFVAEATRNPAGGSIIEMHEADGPGMPATSGILYKADAQGYGKVSYPDFSSCTGPCDPMSGNAPPLVDVTYAYDASHAALQKGPAPVVFKDRGAVVDLANRYGLFDAATGEDVARSHRFGFPVFYDDAGGRHYGYYGAWQGRHQVWADGGQAMPPGTVVTRADRPPGAAPETYTAGSPFVGTLVKRTLVPADVQDVKGLAVETNENHNMTLTWDGSGWTSCIDPVWPPPPAPGDPPPSGPTCADGSGAFADLASLEMAPGDTRHYVGINRWDPMTQQPQNYVYLTQGPLGAGFYLAGWSSSGPPTMSSPPTLWAPSQAGDQLWVNSGGPIYISFDGSGWVKKKLLSFDQSTWTPTFADASFDVPFTLELNREYYINNPGANYVVKRTDAGYQARIEIQSVARPDDPAAFVAGIATFRPQWGDAANVSSYRFETAAGENFLKLVYETVSSQDANNGAVAGAVVTSGQWGLVAYDAGGSPVLDGAGAPVQFNWDYPPPGQTWGAQQFLVQGSSYVLLDNPIRLQPITLANHAGDSKTFQLQFDGSWVQGLPDIFEELRKAGYDLTQDIADKVVLIPAGTEVVDADQPAVHYLFKPLDVQEFMPLVADPGNLSLTLAASLDLSSVPSLQEPGLGPLPDVAVKYSEGKPVQ
jgi:hypothetical protein